MSADHAQTFANAPLDELLSVLLRQLKRPLATYGITLTDTEAERLAAERIAGKPLSLPALLPALVNIVGESEAVLAKMGLTFIASLDTPMDRVSGWETTAEFLDLANEKSNAELRIVLGAALLWAFGDQQYASYMKHLANGDYGDETAIVGRIMTISQ
jgi:hypothetical protein